MNFSLCQVTSSGHLSSDLALTWFLPPINDPFMSPLSCLVWQSARFEIPAAHPAVTTILKGMEADLCIITPEVCVYVKA